MISILRIEECSGETSGALGSAKQAFALPTCLAKDAGPLIAIKKRLGIYDRKWMTVIR
ncbi:hypothetical protein [Lichenifustis flavocetrariae]|uniref:Uncharacterized protein n=1 Tax=Lichenifustis flavocetrariae TaxID=2949735 RepID=A0AA41YZQ3_9HYPH|nr:hypothetical protein [Lichenifustis flavocetrariae]MCW6510230.1 hypothetical protein [Lichenifustis flavocetrariae]